MMSLMPTLRETVAGVLGAWRLLLGDRGAMAWFDTTLHGFWRSFSAAVVVAPIYTVVLLIGYWGLEPAPPVFRIVSVHALAYVIDWVLFPLAMIPFTDFIDRRERYLGFIVAYNWSAVLQYAFYGVLSLFIATGVLPLQASFGVMMVAMVVIMVYVWRIARIALEVPGLMAAGVVAVELFLTMMIEQVTFAMIRMG